MMLSVLLLSPGLRDQLKAEAGRGYPDETCGLLLGREDEGRCTVLLQRPACNMIQERSGDCYAIDPRDYLAAENAAAAVDM